MYHMPSGWKQGAFPSLPAYVSSILWTRNYQVLLLGPMRGSFHPRLSAGRNVPILVHFSASASYEIAPGTILHPSVLHAKKRGHTWNFRHGRRVDPPYLLLVDPAYSSEVRAVPRADRYPCNTDWQALVYVSAAPLCTKYTRLVLWLIPTFYSLYIARSLGLFVGLGTVQNEMRANAYICIYAT